MFRYQFDSSLLPVCARAATQQLNGSSTNLDFGPVMLGQKQTELVALTIGGITGVTISAVSMNGSPEFSVWGISFPMTLAAGKQTTLSLTFSPSPAGWV